MSSNRSPRIAESEARYRLLFNSIDEGVCIIEVLVDKENKPVDYRVLETNPRFKKQTGLTDAIGKTATELGLERQWIDVYGKVAVSGKSNRFTQGSDALGKWFDVYASRVGGSGSLKVAIVFNDISKRKQAETALQNSEERLQLALEASGSVGTWDWDVVNDRVVADARFANLYSVDPAWAAKGAPIAEFAEAFHPDDSQRVQAEIATAMQTGKGFSSEYRLVQKDGSVRWVLARGHCTLDKAGQPLRFPGVTVDITDRKKAEQALEENEERYRLIAKATNDAIWDWNLVTNQVQWNDAVQTLFGYKPKDVGPDATWWYEHIHPDDQKRIVDGIHKVIDAGGESWSDEYRYQKADGTYKYVFDRGYIIHDKKREPLRMIGSMLDLTERKQAEEAIIKARDESERRRRLYEVVTGSTLDLIYVFDRNYKFTYANPALLAMWGKTWSQAIGKGLLDNGYEPWHAKMHQEEIDKVIATKQPIRGEVSFPHATLGKRVYDYIFTPVINDVGEVEAVAGTTRDVTERVQALKDLRQKQELESKNIALAKRHQELMELNKAKDEFISLASHQLRTPATAVKQYIGILLEGILGPLDPQHARTLRIAYESNERQLTIINDLLKTAQIDSDKYQIHREPQNIVSVLKGAVADIKPTYKIKKQSLLFTDPRIAIKAAIDTTEIKLVFMNLLENASKYSHPHSQVIVTVEKKRKTGIVSITDNGVGIDAGNAGRIFDKFTRVNNELSDTVSGTGLGLYLVRQITELHGGTVSLQSEPGSGSTFIIKLPLCS